MLGSLLKIVNLFFSQDSVVNYFKMQSCVVRGDVKAGLRTTNSNKKLQFGLSLIEYSPRRLFFSLFFGSLGRSIGSFGSCIIDQVGDVYVADGQVVMEAELASLGNCLLGRRSLSENDSYNFIAAPWLWFLLICLL